ncbi:MAG: hypothetical protein JRG68_00015 [Deltaproteobacteria bacterium]|nr:hypothetical protein [Deltaproteobacteria bacterium]
MFYKKLYENFLTLAKENDLLDKNIAIQTHVLKPTEAIGTPDRKDFPLLKGKEVLMQALFMGMQGQAYTDAPSKFSGPLRKIMDLNLDDSRQRALFIAALNAVMRYVYPDITTVHCKNNEPDECARKIVEFIQTLNPVSVGLIGLQPAILEALVNRFGAEKIICIDRDEENRGLTKYGVPIEWGDDKGMEKLFSRSNLVLPTGSSVVNGSLADILTAAQKHDTPVYFYGTSVSGCARLMGLNHLCFKST